MIALYALAAWLVGLAVAYVLWCALWTAKHADDQAETEQDPFEQVDAVVFEFPQRRPGGGWVA